MSQVVVTGANRGIGLELCRQFRSRGDSVIGVCRHSSAALDAADVRVIDGVDVATAQGVERLRGAIDGERIDILVNNAGILSRDSFDDLDFDAMAEQFAINAIGPLRVTRGLVGNLKTGATVAVITSRMGSVEDNTSGGYYGYRASKAAVNVIAKSLSVDLADRHIAVAILHPGMVATDMTGGQGVDIAKSVTGLIARIDETDKQSTGTFRHAEGYDLPW